MIFNEKQFKALGRLLSVMDKLGVRLHLPTLTVSTFLNIGQSYPEEYSFEPRLDNSTPSTMDIFRYRITCNQKLFSETKD